MRPYRIIRLWTIVTLSLWYGTPAWAMAPRPAFENRPTGYTHYNRAVDSYDASMILRSYFDAKHFKTPGGIYNIEKFKTDLVDLETVFMEEPNSPQYLLQRGWQKWNLHQNTLALKDFTTAIALEPNSHLSLTLRAGVIASMGFWKEAEQEATSAIGGAPEDGAGYLIRGLALIHQQEYKKAVEDMNKMLELQSSEIWPYIVRGYCLIKDGQYTRSFEDFDRALELEPRSSLTFLMQAKAYDMLLNYDKVKNAYNSAVLYGSNNVDAYLGRADHYAASKKQVELEMAKRDILHAQNLDPDNPAIHLARWSFHTWTGHHRKAKKDAKKACELGDCRVWKAITATQE